MSTLLILNAKIVNENAIIESDLYIRGGRIEKIAKDLSSMKVLHVLDLKGKYLLPGMIDDHVHFREPGFTQRGDIQTESRAAVAGGITTFFDMPNTSPAVTNNQLLEEKMALAAEKSIANYSFYFAATHNNLDDIKAIDPLSSCGLKVYMGGEKEQLLLDDEENLSHVFKHAPLLVATHCEDMPTIIENEENYRQIYGDNIPFELHPKIRTEEACYKASSLAVDLAKQFDSRLHVLHVSTAKEVELFSDESLAEKRITAEVASHFLSFTDEDYERLGGLIKTNPAIKSEVDRAGLFQGLMDGNLDIISSNHAPCLLAEKQGSYFEVLSGMPTAQCALPSLLEHYQDGIFTLEFLVEKISHNVAQLFDIKERGFIREGYWADLVVIDTENGFTANNGDILSRCGWTPFDGISFRSSVYATIVNGSLVYINNTIRNGEQGRRVEFNREQLS